MKRNFLFLTALLAIMLMSCTKSDIFEVNESTISDSIPIEVSFALNDSQTRAMHLPVGDGSRSAIETQIDSISVVAVIGTENNSSLFQYTLKATGNGKFETLLPSSVVLNSNCKLYFIANAGLITNFSKLKTLGELRLAALPEASSSGSDKYVMATNYIPFEVKNGSITIEKIELLPTVARLKFQYQNQLTSIKSVTISGTLKKGNLSELLGSSSSDSDSEELSFEDTDLDFDYANNNQGWGYYYVYPSKSKPVNITIRLEDVPQPRTLTITDLKRGSSYVITVSYKNKMMASYNEEVLDYDPDTNTLTFPDGSASEVITFTEGTTFKYDPVSWLTIESNPNNAIKTLSSTKTPTTLTLKPTANTSTSDRSHIIEVTDIFGKKENLTITQRSSSDIEFVRIPAGKYYMGSPESEANRDNDEVQHQVTLSKSFQMSKYEITNMHYCRFLNAKGVTADGKLNGELLISGSKELLFSGGTWSVVAGKAKHPVVYVSWAGATQFADWAGGALPTEAQWEYACRGDYTNKASEKNTQPFNLGYTLQPTFCNFAWSYRYSTSGEYTTTELNSTGTTPVGNYIAAGNNYGLFDMHGNVWEWCSDFYDANYGSSNATNPVTDPVGSIGGTERVLKGGSWYFFSRTCRSAYRMRMAPGTMSGNIGFRIVR